MYLYSHSLSSDDPRKCDSYWRGSDTRIMFACCVLLGTIKVSFGHILPFCNHVYFFALQEYPHKKTDATLLREPPGYDSVKVKVHFISKGILAQVIHALFASPSLPCLFVFTRADQSEVL